MGNNPVNGALYFLRGFALIFRPGIRAYVVVPLLINITVFTALIYFGAGQLQSFLDSMLPEWLEWLQWLLLPLFLIAGLLIAFFTFNMVANLISAPFRAADRVLHLQHGCQSDLCSVQRAAGGSGGAQADRTGPGGRRL